MSKKIVSKNFILTFFILIILVILALSSFNFISFADETNEGTVQNQLGGSFSYVVKNDNENLNFESFQDYSDGTLYIYKWRNADKIILTYTPDHDNPPPKNSMNEEVYNITISLDYHQGYQDSIFNPITFEKIFDSPNNKNLTFSQLSKSFTFDITNGLIGIPNGGNEEITIKGWGIYRFKIDINGQENYTDFIFIQPDSQIDQPLEIDYTTINSENSMHDSFNFFIKSSAYEFIDVNGITWYVKGESLDGTKYALTQEDIKNNPEFSDCTKYLYENIIRTGSNFIFNDNEISGEWEVWCEYNFHDSNASSKESTNRIKVETGSKINVNVIIYIIVALACLSVIVVVIICVMKNKKEKVW